LLCLRNARAFPLLPAALASVPFGFVLVRVRVRKEIYFLVFKYIFRIEFDALINGRVLGLEACRGSRTPRGLCGSCGSFFSRKIWLSRNSCNWPSTDN
jgi:hypothetical protein